MEAPPTAELSQDRAWLDAFRAGDGHALERVFRVYSPLVFQVVARGARLADGTRVYLSDASQVDDVVQDTFVRLLGPSSRERYDGLRPYGALVRVVARNTLVDHLRKAGRVKDREVAVDDPQDVAASEVESGPPSPEAALVTAERARMADELLAALTEEQRALAKVRFEDGLSQRDAADVLGISRQTIRTLEEKLMERARAFLKKKGW